MGFLKTIKGLFNSDNEGDGTKRPVPSDSPKQRVGSEKDVPKQYTVQIDSPKRGVGGTAKHRSLQPCVPKCDSRSSTKQEAPKQGVSAKKVDGTIKSGTTDGVAKRDAIYLHEQPGYQTACEAHDAEDRSPRKAVQLYEQALSEGYPPTDELCYFLGCHYMKQKDCVNLKRIIAICPAYIFKQPWAVQAKQFLEQHFGKLPNGWIDIDSDNLANDSWFAKNERLQHNFPQFDFDNGDNESKIREEDVDALEEYNVALERRLQMADSLCEKKDYKGAAELYAEFIRNGYWDVRPYDALMAIYDKAQLTEEKKRLAAYAVNFFTELRKKQEQRVLELAATYHSTDFAQKTIADGKRIPYYDGLFILYDPYPQIEQWQKLIGG